MIAANRSFVEQHPIAAKRALRNILKAMGFCAAWPERSAQFLVKRGSTPRYDYDLQMVKDIPYGYHRDLDPEDTARFYALWLREVGMIRSTPESVLAHGTDWRCLNELLQELEA